jgi:hypothetical protein
LFGVKKPVALVYPISAITTREVGYTQVKPDEL